ncbi:MAG TPA: HEAT repeat domain-containing protein [Chthonomonadaceae bacterium]|nr:HEAT repeat domain-containing protein [Chthonomonadaceae bacterium]
MAGLWETTTTWMRCWFAYGNLGSENPAARQQAMQTLRQQGDASLFVLRLALGREDQPKVQFAAAVVLHWLGKPDGLRTLMDVIRWRKTSNATTLTYLENALLTIGAPDAVTALLDVWPSLPADWDDTHPYMQLICRVWQAMRDPRALEGLAMRDLRLPRLFEETAAAFGVQALPLLQRMTEDTRTPDRRALALMTLRRIPGKNSFQILVPLLRDPDPRIRGMVPEALEHVSGPIAACRALTETVRSGYSTYQAVNALWLYRPPDLEETLLALLTRYSQEKGVGGNDTPEAVLEAFRIFTTSPWPPHATLLMCDLLTPPSHPRVAATAARLLVERTTLYDLNIAPARDALWTQLCEMHRESRVECASALSRLGDTYAEQLLTLIEDNCPKGSLLQTLQTMLSGGPDAGQAASRAVQQVTQWFNRLSKETAERLSGSAASNDPLRRAFYDPNFPERARLLGRLRQMLERSLDRLETAWNPDELEDILGVCVGLIRTLVRLGGETIPQAHEPLLRALRCVKYNITNQLSASALPLRTEVGEMVREAAASALMQWYGVECLPLLVETLHTPEPPVQITAMQALGSLGDVRALPALQPFVEGPSPQLAPVAQNAISAIKRTNPEMMTLLRASSGSDVRPETLLRPASGNPETTSSDLLLRPSNPGD